MEASIFAFKNWIFSIMFLDPFGIWWTTIASQTRNSKRRRVNLHQPWPLQAFLGWGHCLFSFGGENSHPKTNRQTNKTTKQTNKQTNKQNKPNQNKPNQTKPNQIKPNQTKPNKQNKPNHTKTKATGFCCHPVSTHYQSVGCKFDQKRFGLTISV